MIADLTHWWRWSPDAAWDMTGTQLLWWYDQTQRIAARQAAARE